MRTRAREREREEEAQRGREMGGDFSKHQQIYEYIYVSCQRNHHEHFHKICVCVYRASFGMFRAYIVREKCATAFVEEQGESKKTRARERGRKGREGKEMCVVFVFLWFGMHVFVYVNFRGMVSYNSQNGLNKSC